MTTRCNFSARARRWKDKDHMALNRTFIRLFISVTVLRLKISWNEHLNNEHARTHEK